MRRAKEWELARSKPAPKKRRTTKPYAYKEPKPLSMNVYILDEDEVLQMVLRDRRLKER